MAGTDANTSTARLLRSPLRNLGAAVAFVLAVAALSILGYLAAGWSLADAVYMVVLTIFTVGYGEVRPIDTPELRALTIGCIVLGCTGMIVLTGALVQVFTLGQIEALLGVRRVNSEIEKLRGHVIICGFGRIGVMLARDLKVGGADFLVVDRDEARIAEARALGYLSLHADAVDEAGLMAAGILRARVLATVLPDDSANVFITLTARSLSPDLHIIARGEAPSTESKLIYAGANEVVLPTHIGAERIAEMILHPATARLIHGSPQMQALGDSLRGLGLQLEVMTVAEGGAAEGATVAELEQRGRGGFFIVQVDRRSGESLARPAADVRVEAGDGVVVMARAGVAALTSLFQGPAERVRAGRTLF